jgi:hypothetical protein
MLTDTLRSRFRNGRIARGPTKICGRLCETSTLSKKTATLRAAKAPSWGTMGLFL